MVAVHGDKGDRDANRAQGDIQLASELRMRAGTVKNGFSDPTKVQIGQG